VAAPAPAAQELVEIEGGDAKGRSDQNGVADEGRGLDGEGEGGKAEDGAGEQEQEQECSVANRSADCV
jgi:hypothetical protein